MISKKSLTIIAIAASLCVITGTACGVMIPSYLQYKDYYDAAVSEKEHQKYLDSLPLTLEGISASLKDGVNYYANGKASPKGEDFSVMAHFSEKGKDFDRLLQAKDFSLEVPEDFAAKGGTVVVSYSMTEKNEDGTDKEPQTATAEVPIELEAVRLSSLVLKEKPYRVYYPSNLNFDPDGMAVEAVYNDGDRKDIETSQLKVESTALHAGDTEAVVSYEEDGTKVTLSVPIRVDDPANYDEGNLLRLEPEAEVVLEDGASMDSATPRIRATYQSGNRLILQPDEYVLKGNVPTASFSKNCVLTVTKKGNDSLRCLVSVAVRKVVEAESTEHADGTVKERNVVGEDGSTTTSTVLSDASSLSFTLESSSIAKTSFSLSLASLNAPTSSLTLGEALSLTVNGEEIPLDETESLPEASTGEALNEKQIVLPSLVLGRGTNTITFTRKAKDGTLPSLALDRFVIGTKYEGPLFTDTSEYISDCASKGKGFNASIEPAVPFGKATGGTNQAYVHGLATDGSYVYATYTSWSSGLRNEVIRKYDATTFDLVATSQPINQFMTESTAGITCYDGKVIVYGVTAAKDGTGRMAYIDSSAFVDGASFTICESGSEILRFDGLENAVIRDVYYNELQERFAVLVGDQVSIYDKTMKNRLSSFTLKVDLANNNLTRLTGNKDFIFANFSHDSNYRPEIAVYDWDGNRVGEVTIPNSVEGMGGESAVNKPEKTNTQGICFLNDAFYFIVLRFNQNGLSDAGAIYRSAVESVSEFRDDSLTVGEYSKAAEGLYQESYEITPAKGSDGALGEPDGWYGMGSVADEDHLFLGKSFSTEKPTTAIYEFDPKTFAFRKKSAQFANGTAQWADSSQIFLKDGKIYCLVDPGENKVKALAMSASDIDGKTPTEEALPFADKTDGKVLSVYYASKARRYAVIDEAKKLYLFDDDGNLLRDPVTIPDHSGFSLKNVTGDSKYLYVSFKANGQTSLPIEIFSMDGEHLASSNPTGTFLSVPQYNVQSLFSYEDTLYASVCSWASGGFHLFKIRPESKRFRKAALVSITATLSGDKKYTTGESIRNDLLVTATYNDGTSEVVTDYQLSPEKLDTAGTNVSVLVSYAEPNQLTRTAVVDGLTVTRSENTYFGNYVKKATSEDGLTFSAQSISNTSGIYTMGGAFKDGYLYLATADNDKTSSHLNQIDSKTMQVVATKDFKNKKFSDGDQLFFKGTKLYIVASAGDVYSIDVGENGSSFATATVTADTLPVTGSSVTYEEKTGKYAYLPGGGTLKIASSDGTELHSVTLSAKVPSDHNGQSASSVTSDGKYVYVSYKINDQADVLILVYDWDGNYIGQQRVQKADTPSNNYNIQAIFFDDSGNLYATVCTWSGQGDYRLWKVEMSY